MREGLGLAKQRHTVRVRTRTASRDARTHRSRAVFQASPSGVGGSWGFLSKQASELNESSVLGLPKG